MVDRGEVQPRRTNSLAAVTAAWALVVAAPAHAGWKTPAGGPSASGDPEVVLTFDDGPGLRPTTAVLDTLAARDIQAVFFLVGRWFERGGADRARATLARMLREGHVIASHSMTHPNLCRGDEAAAAAEIDDARRVLEREARMPVPWFRAPFGAHCARLPRLLDARGITHWYWDIDPQEWKTGSAKLTEQRVIAKLKRLTGRAVVLLHDTKAATARALPKILDWIDAENARRLAAGKRPIRIVDAPQLARERLGEARLAEARALAEDAATALATGLASALPGAPARPATAAATTAP